MQPHEKSVNLFVCCLFVFRGSTKTIVSNKHETTHARRHELFTYLLSLTLNLVDLGKRE